MPTLCVSFFDEYEGPEEWLAVFGAMMQRATQSSGWTITDEEEGADASLEIYVGELFHYEAQSADAEPWAGLVIHTGLPRNDVAIQSFCDSLVAWLVRGPSEHATSEPTGPTA